MNLNLSYKIMPLDKEQIFEILREVKDPEVPVIDVVELGIVRDAAVNGDSVDVTITPTYSGCPAMKLIEDQVCAALLRHGAKSVNVKMVYAPAWTTDWISAEGKEKLRVYGIAPPHTVEEEPLVMLPSAREKIIACPFCKSQNTHKTSEFGPTACKALYFCDSCIQPFEYFKAF